MYYVCLAPALSGYVLVVFSTGECLLWLYQPHPIHVMVVAGVTTEVVCEVLFRATQFIKCVQT